MKSMAFAERTRKEIVRDPLNIVFGLGFPLVLLFLLTALQANIPAEIFVIDHLAPGIAVFGLSFISLFSGMLISKDRSTSFLTRLFTAPLSASNYILGYTLPLIFMAFLQILICFLAALFLGLPLNLNMIFAILALTPTIILFIGIGLLSGSVLNDKQVGGICGAILTNVSAWLSGIWFDLNLIGGWFKEIAYILPFAHAVEAGRSAIAGNYASVLSHLWWVIGYAVGIMVLAIYMFRKKMSGDAA